MNRLAFLLVLFWISVLKVSGAPLPYVLTPGGTASSLTLTGTTLIGNGASLTNPQSIGGTTTIATNSAVNVLLRSANGTNLFWWDDSTHQFKYDTNFGVVANGSSIQFLNAASITSGTLPLARLSGINTQQMDIATQTLFTNLNKAFRIPQQFGAVGDGTTDDTVALQNWLNYCSSNYCTAKLPPAPGGYYKITDTLYVTNGIQIEGGGGGKHTTSGSRTTQAHIRQFTRNKTALQLLNAVDSLHIDNIVITADPPNNFTNLNCYGIYFDGGGPDSDCSLIEQVGVQNFGVGFNAVSVADTTFSACTPGYNSYGIYIAGIANNITLSGGQYSYNWSNQIYAGAADGLIISGCDIAAEHVSAQGCYFQNNVAVTFIGSRFEDYSTNDMVKCGSTNSGWGVDLTMVNTRFYNFIDTAGLNRKCIAATNADIVLISTYPNAVTFTAADFAWKGLDALNHVWSTPPATYTDFTSGSVVRYAYGTATNLAEFTNSIPANAIQGVKLASQTVTGDKVAVGTITPTNTVGATFSYILPSGDSISFSNGLVTALTPITWDTDALAYFTLAGTSDITQKVAINYLATQSKAIGFWTNSQAIYPMVGSYLTNAVYNLRTNAFHLVNHSCTYSPTGFVFVAASSSWLDTGITPATTPSICNAGQDSYHLGLYLESTRTIESSAYLIGMYDDFRRLYVGYNFALLGMAGFNNNFGLGAGPPGLSTNTIGDVRGPLLATRTGASAQSLYVKTFSNSTTDASSGAPPNSATIAIGARNQYGGQDHFSTMTAAGASIGAGINSTMAANVQAMWDTYNAILGRKVP